MVGDKNGLWSSCVFSSRGIKRTNTFILLHYVILILAVLFLISCGEGNIQDEKNPSDSSHEKLNLEDQSENRFLSRDRKKEEILADYEKPIVSYPAINSAESRNGEDGLIYRDGIDKPFTGRIIDRFENGDVKMDSSYLNGQPHGLQIRYHENRNPALEATFDNGRLSGVKTRWWENGLIREEEYWSEGNYRGRKLWDEAGRVTKEEILP